MVRWWFGYISVFGVCIFSSAVSCCHAGSFLLFSDRFFAVHHVDVRHKMRCAYGTQTQKHEADNRERNTVN